MNKVILKHQYHAIKLHFHKLISVVKDRKDLTIMSKKNTSDGEVAERAVKSPVKQGGKSFMFGILGICIALVMVSITYSTAVILLGTQGITPKIMLLPQVSFAAAVICIAFYKIFK